MPIETNNPATTDSWMRSGALADRINAGQVTDSWARSGPVADKIDAVSRATDAERNALQVMHGGFDNVIAARSGAARSVGAPDAINRSDLEAVARSANPAVSPELRAAAEVLLDSPLGHTFLDLGSGNGQQDGHVTRSDLEGALAAIDGGQYAAWTDADPLTGDADHASVDVKVTGKIDAGGESASLSWNPDAGKVTLSSEQKLEIPAGRSARLSTAVTNSVAYAQSSGDGASRFVVEAEAGVKSSVSIEAGGKGGASLDLGTAAGVNSSWEVTLPGEGRTALEAAAVNPFDPTSIPVGGQVTLNGETFVATEFAASFRYIATKTDVREAAGVSWMVERTDADTVRVMAGPTESISAFNGMGVRVSKDVSAYAGRADSLAGKSLQTATFDLSTADGQAAWAHFTATGQIAHATAGVSDVATIERVDYSSQTQLHAKLGPISAELGGAQNTGSVVQTTYPDGSGVLSSDLHYSGNVPLHITQRFSPAGIENTALRSYSFAIDGDVPGYNWFERFMGQDEAAEERGIAQMLNVALTGDPGGAGPVQPGVTTTLTFSETQLQSLLEQTRTAAAPDASGVGGDWKLGLLVEVGDGEPASTRDFAIAMARNLGGDPWQFAARLQTIAQAGAGDDAGNGLAAIDAQVSTD